MQSNSNLFSIKQLQNKGNISLNLSKTFTMSKRQLQGDSSISSESLVKNSFKDPSSKFKKHKESVENAETLAKTVGDQYLRIAQLRELIREQKNEIAEKKTDNYGSIRELKAQVVNLERENQNYKHNSMVRIKKKEREVEGEFERIRSHQIPTTKEYRQQVSKLSSTSHQERYLSLGKSSKRSPTQSQLARIASDKENLFSELEKQHQMQRRKITESMKRTAKYSQKLENLGKEEGILTEIYKRYSTNSKVIGDIQKVLLKKQNNSKLLMAGYQIDWGKFPVLESLEKGDCFYSTIKAGYRQLLESSSNVYH